MSLSTLRIIAEQKIADAVANGELDNLPGSGRPLELEDFSSVPPELRMAYKILKNASFAPPEIAERKEIQSLLDLLEDAADEKTRVRAITRLRVLTRRFEEGRSASLARDDEYYQKILGRLERQERKSRESRDDKN